MVIGYNNIIGPFNLNQAVFHIVDVFYRQLAPYEFPREISILVIVEGKKAVGEQLVVLVVIPRSIDARLNSDGCPRHRK